MFHFVPNVGIANYADDNTSHDSNEHLKTVLKDLEQRFDTMLKWFIHNLLKANPEKYHLHVSTNKKRHLNVGGRGGGGGGGGRGAVSDLD